MGQRASRTRVAGLVLLAIVLGWGGWLSFRDRTAETRTEERRVLEQTKAESAVEERAKEQAAGAAIRPRSVVERDDEAASSQSSAGPASAPTATTGSIAGEVLAPDGSPVEGATVFTGDPAVQGLLQLDEEMMRPRVSLILSQTDVLKATTTAKGTFRFDGVAPASAFTVGATHPDLGLVVMFRVPVRAGEERFVTLRYEAGVRFFGRVTDQDLRPVMNAKVRVNGFKDGTSTKQLSFVQTDPSGNYRQDPATGTEFNLSVNAEGYYVGSARVKDLAPEVREHRVDISLEPAPLLRGRLVLPDGTPARVSEHLKKLFGSASPFNRVELVLLVAFDDPRSDPNFRLLGHGGGRLLLDEDAYELAPESKEIKYLSLWVGNDLLGLAELKAPDVAPDIIVDWSKVSPPKPRGALEIVVTSRADHSPVTDYSVRITGPLSAPLSDQSNMGSVVTSADGRCHFPFLVAGKYEIVVRAAGYDTAKSTGEVKAGSEASEAAVELVPASQSPATASVAGIVRGPARESINGATVWLVPERAERSGDFKRAQTNAEGVFQFEKLLPDSYLVIAEAPRSSRLAPGWTRAIAPASDAVVSLTEGVEVRLVPDGTSGPFSFRILDSAGVPLVDDLRSQTQRWGGSHSIVLAPGRYEVQASCPGFTPARASFVAAEGVSVTLKFERAPK